MTQKNIQSNPVVRASAGDYQLAALVGEEAVILGWTMDDAIDRSDLLGFAIKRTRREPHAADADARWLPNHRRFPLRSNGGLADDVTTKSDPLQQFYFLDRAIECGSPYTYAVQPVRGTPTLRYYEAPVSVTVHPLAAAANDESGDSVASVLSATAGLTMAASARQHYRFMSDADLAHEIRRFTGRARSAVFLYSSVPLRQLILDVMRGVNSGRLLYGLVPGRDDELAEVRRAHNTAHLTRPLASQRLDPISVFDPIDAGVARYTSALVTDPWSRCPGILLWSDMPGATAKRVVDTRVITRDKRAAARLATGIFQAHASGCLPQVAPDPQHPERHLEPDGRWSNIYFSRHAASHKYREREIFSGQP